MNRAFLRAQPYPPKSRKQAIADSGQNTVKEKEVIGYSSGVEITKLDLSATLALFSGNVKKANELMEESRKQKTND